MVNSIFQICVHVYMFYVFIHAHVSFCGIRSAQRAAVMVGHKLLCSNLKKKCDSLMIFEVPHSSPGIDVQECFVSDRIVCLGCLRCGACCSLSISLLSFPYAERKAARTCAIARCNLLASPLRRDDPPCTR